ncbi:MAG: DUF3068 domain-containing protein [Chloroflexi bacterium]|nr:DUF3068 domain-containing protein [Chloroflexota bacterium]
MFRNKVRVIAATAGAALVVAGAVWMTVVYPGLERIPSDFRRNVELEGTATVVDQQFLARVSTSEAISKLRSNPEIMAALAKLDLKAIRSNPAALANVQDPVAKKVLADPTVQAILADTQVLSLVLDPRTQAMLVSPADLPVVQVPVLVRREQIATAADSERVFINEKLAYLDPQSLKPIPGLASTEANLVVDRSSREYLPGTDGGRTGLFGLPFHVDPDRTYSAWVTGAGRPLDAVFAGEEAVEGLTTYRHEVSAEGLSLGRTDPITGLPLAIDADITVSSEPATGVAVSAVDVESVHAVDPAGRRYQRFGVDLRYTDATVSALVAEARSDRSTVVNLGKTVPWGAIGIGAAIVLVAVVPVGRRKVTETGPVPAISETGAKA